jgi:hypothetical protein
MRISGQVIADSQKSSWTADREDAKSIDGDAEVQVSRPMAREDMFFLPIRAWRKPRSV